MIKRTSRRIPGYDCTRHPCGKNRCGTNQGSNHGIHNEEWEYVISNGEVSLSLHVSSGIYPDSVPKQHDADKPCGSVISLHVGFPLSPGQVAGRLEDNAQSCDFVSSGHCYQGIQWCGYVVAREFTNQHFVRRDPSHVSLADFEQPKSFWKALEAQFHKWATEAYAQRADTKYVRCMHCDGTGTVAKP
jgi:hypothetical protein